MNVCSAACYRMYFLTLYTPCERRCVGRHKVLCILLRMWWLRSVGSIKLQVSFAEYRLFYRSLLQKRPTF